MGRKNEVRSSGFFRVFHLIEYPWRLLADAVQSKQKLAEYEEQLKDAMDVVQSHFFNTLGADDKRRLNEELATLTTDCESAKQAVEDIMNKLVAHGSWPVAPPPETPMEQEMAKRHAEIVEYVQELHDTVSKMNGLLGDIAQLKKPPTLPGSSDEDDKPEDDGMPMEVDHASLPTRKRRRLSESVNDASSHTTMETASSSADLPSREELNSVLEQLVRFEGLAETVSNDMTQHAAELSLNFKTRVEDVVEELEANFIATQQQQNSQLMAQAEAREAEVRAVRAESESMGTQVGEMADEVSSLALKVEKLELDVETRRRERQESFERVLQVRFLSLTTPNSKLCPLVLTHCCDSRLNNASNPSKNPVKPKNAPFKLSKQLSRHINPAHRLPQLPPCCQHQHIFLKRLKILLSRQ